MQVHTSSLGFWQCHLDARASGVMPADPAPATDTGRKACAALLEQARAMSRKASAPALASMQERARFTGLTSWTDTPREYRRMLAVMASLPPSLADKSDRDLSENEKALLRAAAKRISQGISGLAASL